MVYLRFILYAVILYLLFIRLIPSIIIDILKFAREVFSERESVSTIAPKKEVQE